MRNLTVKMMTLGLVVWAMASTGCDKAAAELVQAEGARQAAWMGWFCAMYPSMCAGGGSPMDDGIGCGAGAPRRCGWRVVSSPP